MRKPVVMVTGASGFTGRYLVPTLRGKGYGVVGLGKGVSTADQDFVCDLTDPAEVRAAVLEAQPTYVVHLAGLAFVHHDDNRALYDVNLFGTLNLLDALGMLPTSPRKVLIASSANVYGVPANDQPIAESLCPAPINHYACSKLSMEHMVRTWFDRLPIVITRPFNYTGIGQDEKFLIPKIAGHLQRRAHKIELGNLNVSRDFLDVRDVVDAYIGLLESAAQSDVFNICSGKTVAIRSVLDTMVNITGHFMQVEVNPAFIRPNEIPVLCGSPRKLAEAIGFAPRHTLNDTLAWMLRGKSALGDVA